MVSAEHLLVGTLFLALHAFTSQLNASLTLRGRQVVGHVINFFKRCLRQVALQSLLDGCKVLEVLVIVTLSKVSGAVVVAAISA